MDSLKMLVIGTPHAGTTTFIRSVSETAVLSTERRLGTGRGDVINLDFGRVFTSPDLALYLFGIPAPDMGSFPWDTVSPGCVGVVVLGDASSETSIRTCRDVAAALAEDPDTPFVVALTQWRETDADAMDRVRSRLSIASDVPLLTCSARDRACVKGVLGALVGRALALSAAGGSGSR